MLKIGEGVELWYTADKKCFATVKVQEHLENLELGEPGFKRWLSKQFYAETGGAPGGQALAETIAVLEQIALEGVEHQPYLRIGAADGALYLDLGDPSWRAVQVTGAGWQVIARPPVKFIRSPAMKEIPEPEAGYGLASALLDGLAAEVGVPVTDLNATLGRAQTGVLPTIVLDDDVPGGAGLVAHIEDPGLFQRSLTQAHNRVSGACGCGEDASCYGCLRSYRNQFSHPHLRRGSVRGYLEQVLGALLA